ncbi:MAG: polyphosphate kinase 1 [SAR86 cluster bacterium]|uniref:Polyphosphate kinase n=1 Tax=SAR86 cluster bacterium TaxID=2030880 RepID=A0A2A5CBG7_9GAMM|nr:MAG: polyphosphate kinase 1 [SAR86 cluster bacterium]
MDISQKKEIELNNPDYFINRELSFLEFNRRVLAQARDKKTPLLERLFFICIASSNMDEFFEIRVSGLKQQVAYGSTQRGPDNLSPSEQLELINKAAHRLQNSQYKILNDEVLPALANEDVHFLHHDRWNRTQSIWIKKYFNRELLPVLSPVGLDPAHPFPKVLNKSLNFIITLEGKDAFGRNTGIAIVQAPRALPRLIQLPSSCASHKYDFVFLSSIIHKHAADLFPGMTVTGCYEFRATRNSDLFVSEEEAGDLMRALEGELPSRRFAEVVRLEVTNRCPQEIIDFLMHKFTLQPADVYPVDGPVNLNRMMAIPNIVDLPELQFPTFTPALQKRLIRSENIFDTIKKGDVFLHHPFQSFTPVVDFLRQASADPNVLAIKQTLYRTGDDSSIVEALIAAAHAGKEVTVVIELRARFDEEENIELANELQNAGVHVSYGVVGHKTHAKMILVIRREGRQLKRYVHLGTGNYHAKTARLYTDLGMLSSDTAITDDVQKVFQQLTALGKAGKLKKILQAPFTLHKSMMEFIQIETENALKGETARIIAKMNSLVEPEIIKALYRASQAGVKIDLIVRGICCLRPGIKGVSDNIQVRSIIGRFLEHSRIFYFYNAGDIQLFGSSADWMDRNFFRRIETCFPIEDKRMKKKVVKECLLNYLSDNTQSWILHADGSYKKSILAGSKAKSAQQSLLKNYTE